MMRDAGALDTALELLVSVEAGPPDDRLRAEVRCQRGQIALEQQRGADAARLLLDAAGSLARWDAAPARETYLDALVAAMWAGESADIAAVAVQVRHAPRPSAGTTSSPASWAGRSCCCVRNG